MISIIKKSNSHVRTVVSNKDGKRIVDIYVKTEKREVIENNIIN